MPETLACLTISAEGGKTRVSFSTDSICADMTTVSSFLMLDKQELHRGELHWAPAAMIEIMKSQPYATLAPGPHRANQNTNPAYCKANRPWTQRLHRLHTRPCRVDAACAMMVTFTAPTATRQPSTMPGSPWFPELK